MIKLAFAGFRHGHILDVYAGAQESDALTIVAAAEDDGQTRDQLAEQGTVRITHDSYLKMLDETECDAVAVGDYYGRRGEIMIEALSRGKHVIADKPICTSLDEIEKIKQLSKEKGLSVGCQLDMRGAGKYITVRELVQDGAIGEIQAATIGGQHPLLLGSRPSWYFEPGKHGGTINDIGIHAFDIMRWITGMEYAEIACARSWNAYAKEYPHFHDGAQFVIVMENGCGVMGDVSYFMPGVMGYGLDLSWRLTLFGEKGIIETSYNAPAVRLIISESQESRMIDPAENVQRGYLTSFVNEVSGGGSGIGPSTADVLIASEVALKVQERAYCSG